jgi:hypothetical protein
MGRKKVGGYGDYEPPTLPAASASASASASALLSASGLASVTATEDQTEDRPHDIMTTLASFPGQPGLPIPNTLPIGGADPASDPLGLLAKARSLNPARFDQMMATRQQFRQQQVDVRQQHVAMIQTQFADAAYQLEQAGRIHVEVQELADHFGLDERQTRDLDALLKNRKDTFGDDVYGLWANLKNAHNPGAMCTVKMREMRDGSFVGRAKPSPEVRELQKKFKLDDQAMGQLAQIFGGTGDTKKDMLDQLDRHLEVSNQPSSRVMMLLKKLRMGEPLGEPHKTPAPGSYLDKVHEKERKDKEATKRSSSRRRQREKSRDRRSSSRGRGRSRSRSRDRDRRGRNDSRDRRR